MGFYFLSYKKKLKDIFGMIKFYHIRCSIYKIKFLFINYFSDNKNLS